jgi:hypothetical protein
MVCDCLLKSLVCAVRLFASLIALAAPAMAKEWPSSFIVHPGTESSNGRYGIQSAQDNRSEKNLVLTCVGHASTIDDPSSLSAYPVQRLREWKTKQLEEYDRLQQRWSLDPEMAHEAIQASFSNVAVAVVASTINPDGQGGKAPGAGGGGGGAIDLNARGGDGDQVSARINLAEARNAGLIISKSSLAREGPDHLFRAGEARTVRTRS